MKVRELRLPFYVGGFMGPFGATVILPMFPELRHSFNVSSQTIGWGFTAYLLPFALLLLVSGTLGERWGRGERSGRRTFIYASRRYYAQYHQASLCSCLREASKELRMHSSHPLLLSGLAEMVPPERFGRQVGIYSSFQALGVGIAPIMGGVAADTCSGFLGNGCSFICPFAFPTNWAAKRRSESTFFGTLLQGRFLRIGFATLAVAAGLMGVNILVAVAARG